MIDSAQLISMAIIEFQELSRQTNSLGLGLQNAAPGNKTGTPNLSIQYLLDTSQELSEIANQCEKLNPLLSQSNTSKNHGTR